MENDKQTKHKKYKHSNIAYISAIFNKTSGLIFVVTVSLSTIISAPSFAGGFMGSMRGAIGAAAGAAAGAAGAATGRASSSGSQCSTGGSSGGGGSGGSSGGSSGGGSGGASGGSSGGGSGRASGNGGAGGRNGGAAFIGGSYTDHGFINAGVQYQYSCGEKPFVESSRVILCWKHIFGNETISKINIRNKKYSSLSHYFLMYLHKSNAKQFNPSFYFGQYASAASLSSTSASIEVR